MSKLNFVLTDFTEIQKDFNELFPNPEVHEVGAFGFLKLAQHAHAYSKIQALNKRGDFPFHALKFRFKQILKNCTREKLIGKYELQDEVLLLPKRVDNILGSRDSILVRTLLESELKHVQTIDIHQNFPFSNIQLYPHKPWALRFGKQVIQMHHALCQWLRKIERTVDTSDFSYYTAAAATFLHEFMFWNTVISGSRLKKLYLVTHYHQEGLIAAARLAGAEIIEFQHGLVSKHDLYYLYELKYAEVYKKSFFPNEFWVFGRFWANKFLGSADETFMNIKIKGDFRWRNKNKNQEEKRNVILVSTQKNMFHLYAKLIKRLDELLNNYANWICEVKLHPLENDVDSYFQLEHSEKVKILPIDSDIHEVLSYSRIQLSIYSTTFYDALGHNVCNYAWVDSGVSSDYVTEVIEEGIAHAFKFNDDIIQNSLVSAHEMKVNKNEVFQDYIQV